MHLAGYAQRSHRGATCTSYGASTSGGDRYPSDPRCTADQPSIECRLAYFLIAEYCADGQQPQSRAPAREHNGERVIMTRVTIEHNRNHGPPKTTRHSHLATSRCAYLDTGQIRGSARAYPNCLLDGANANL